MAITVDARADDLVVTLSGWDRVASGRRRLIIPFDHVTSSRVVRRGELECHIDHRVVGLGPHDGEQRPGRRRVGVMMGRDVAGKQFWAVTAGDADTQLLVVDLNPPVDAILRAALECERPAEIAARLAS